MEHQLHYCKKFYLDKKTGYWISTTLPRIRAHVWVWKHHNGNIPNGMHIHHIDCNKSNNQIENIQLLTCKEHREKHFSKERADKNLIHIESIRPLTKDWHRSEKGLEWHREHGLKTWHERQPFQVTCRQCGKIEKTKTYHQGFCSNSCKSSYRRKEGLDDEKRQCPICQTKFKVNKYAKTRTCSRKCGCVLRSKKH